MAPWSAVAQGPSIPPRASEIQGAPFETFHYWGGEFGGKKGTPVVGTA